MYRVHYGCDLTNDKKFGGRCFRWCGDNNCHGKWCWSTLEWTWEPKDDPAHKCETNEDCRKNRAWYKCTGNGIKKTACSGSKSGNKNAKKCEYP